MLTVVILPLFTNYSFIQSMKIFEINGFRRWAENYIGDHEVTRYIKRDKLPHDFSFHQAMCRVNDALKLSRTIKNLNPDMIICQSFGSSYSGNRSRRFLKYAFEFLLVRIICSAVKKAGVPFAITDVSDEFTIHYVNLPLIRACTLYFKRELPVDGFLAFESFKPQCLRAPMLHYRRLDEWKKMLVKLRPLPLGCRQKEPNLDPISVAEKSHDIFYVGNDEDKPTRKGIEGAFDQLRDDGFKVNFPSEPLELDQYFEAIRNSRLALSPPGLGWDCHRHYEAAFLGSVPVLSYPTIQRDFPLQNEVHCLFYDPELPLTPQIAAMLSDASRLQEISLNARELVMTHHTHRAHFQRIVSLTLQKFHHANNPKSRPL